MWLQKSPTPFSLFFLNEFLGKNFIRCEIDDFDLFKLRLTNASSGPFAVNRKRPDDLPAPLLLRAMHKRPTGTRQYSFSHNLQKFSCLALSLLTFILFSLILHHNVLYTIPFYLSFFPVLTNHAGNRNIIMEHPNEHFPVDLVQFGLLAIKIFFRPFCSSEICKTR